VKILGFTFAVITVILATVFMMLSWQTRGRLQRAIVANVESSQQRFAELEAHLQAGQRLQAATLAENPTLKAAVDTYQTEGASGGPKDQLRNTLRVELGKLGQTIGTPVLAVTDIAGVILASSGPAAREWPAGSNVALPIGVVAQPVETVVVQAKGPFLAMVVPLVLGSDLVGQLVLATPIDSEYASRLQREVGTGIAVVHAGRLVTSSLSGELETALRTVALPENGTLRLGDEEYVVRRLRSVDSVQVYAVESVTAAVRAATHEVATVFLAIGLGALMLAAIASLWLARTLAAPIDELRTTLAQMAESRDFERALQPSGASFELDALTDTFDRLRSAVSSAEAESENTYLGVIGALAAALDARDPYTAGHSERVAHLSVAVGQEMGLSEEELEVLRLGALLHDIGKIGVSDAVLRKPGTLNDDEMEQIKRHPSLGARILRPLNFLSEQIAIVELHHEQPDGQGYPFGLKGDETPLFARIVHVADAFDAMTTARAYRPGRPATDAMAELWRCAGTSFDLAVVQAMAAVPATVLMRIVNSNPTGATELVTPVGGALVPFRLRAAGSQMRRTAS
jgi:putative nucleotidyltransferase with HDIG domain